MIQCFVETPLTTCENESFVCNNTLGTRRMIVPCMLEQRCCGKKVDPVRNGQYIMGRSRSCRDGEIETVNYGVDLGWYTNRSPPIRREKSAFRMCYTGENNDIWRYRLVESVWYSIRCNSRLHATWHRRLFAICRNLEFDNGEPLSANKISLSSCTVSHYLVLSLQKFA